MHEPIPKQGQSLGQAVRGYHAGPSNYPRLAEFHYRVKALWPRTLRRCSQKDRSRWAGMARRAAAYGMAVAGMTFTAASGIAAPQASVPTNVVAKAWPTQALVSFTAAAAPAGKGIVSYTVTGVNASWLSATAPTSPIMTHGGWSAGSPNNFTVHANYSDGTKSAESTESNKVLPTLPPGSSSTSPYVYWNGVFYWSGDYSYGSGLSENYTDTTGGPTYGADFMVQYSSSGGWQPFAPHNAYDLTPYKYLIFQWKSSVANDPLTITSELEGDKIVGTSVVINDSTYGPTPKAGVWGTYKVPLSALGIGAPAGVPILYKLALHNPSGTFARVEYFQQIEFSAN
jgi:hypothetical protein